MKEHKQRVFEEKIDLKDKIGKLRNFALTDNPVFNKLSLVERELLLEQLYFMEKYLSVLNSRIDTFKN